MTLRVAINGLGRIGRCVMRAIAERGGDGITLVAANGPAPTPTHLHLLTYDSIHGFFGQVQQTGDDELTLGKQRVKLFHERDPKKLPWKELGIDVVLECSGHFTDKAGALGHVHAGAKKVLVSAPSADADVTIVYGVNDGWLKPEHQIVSVGSCTTNCLAPVAKLLHDHIGIESGYMTTIHAYTSDQNLLDNSHKDLRRARSAPLSMVPTSTGAAKALSLVIPELAGKLSGTSIRVPVPNVSCVDLTFTAGKDTSEADILAIMKQAASHEMKGVVAVNELSLVSSDFNHHPASAIFDATGTSVIHKRFVRVMMWYDNEWGFSNRMLDVVQKML